MTWSEYLAAQLERARGLSLHTIEDFSDDDFYRKFDNINPGIWVLGHMSCSVPSIVFTALGEPVPLPPDWSKWFAIKTKVLDDLHQYPSTAEIRRVLNEGQQITLQRIKKLTDQELLAPSDPQMQVLPWLKTVRDAISLAVIHESNHGGQLMWLRKLVGKPGLI
jgi:hypothetical protein